MLTTVRPISSSETHLLRQQILRPHQSLAEMHYPGDDALQTVHLGAFDGPALVGIASLYGEGMPHDPREGDWRLRGMAVDPAMQGSGVGRKLIKACLAHIRDRGGRRFWCNARTSAAGFYRRFGMTERGQVVDVITIGPHVAMAVDLP